MSMRIPIGGTANLSTVGSTNGMGAVSGFVNGASYGENNGEPKVLDDGAMEFPNVHYFLDRDGSRIQTEGRTVMRMQPDGMALFTAYYTVVAATGRYSGCSGEFRSSGWVRTEAGPDEAEAGVGAARFEGFLTRD